MNNLPNWLTSSEGYGLAMRWKAFLLGLIPGALQLADVLCTLRAVCIQLNESFIVQTVESTLFVIALMMFGVGWGKAKLRKDNNLGKFRK